MTHQNKRKRKYILKLKINTKRDNNIQGLSHTKLKQVIPKITRHIIATSTNKQEIKDVIRLSNKIMNNKTIPKKSLITLNSWIDSQTKKVQDYTKGPKKGTKELVIKGGNWYHQEVVNQTILKKGDIKNTTIEKLHSMKIINAKQKQMLINAMNKNSSKAKISITKGGGKTKKTPTIIDKLSKDQINKVQTYAEVMERDGGPIKFLEDYPDDVDRFADDCGLDVPDFIQAVYLV